MDRSLIDRAFYYAHKYDNRLTTLERLADAGYFRNNRQLNVSYSWPSFPRLCRVIGSMADLETLSLLEWELTLTQDVPQLFRLCPKLTELRMKLVESQNLEMNEDLKNELRPGFQRFKIFELKWDINSWPIIQEMFT